MLLFLSSFVDTQICPISLIELAVGMNGLLIMAVKSLKLWRMFLTSWQNVFRETKIVLARRTGSLSVCNEDYVLTQALFQKKWSITLLYSTKHHSKRRSTSHKGHIANLQGTEPNPALGVKILMMNALAEEPRDGKDTKPVDSDACLMGEMGWEPVVCQHSSRRKNSS